MKKILCAFLLISAIFTLSARSKKSDIDRSKTFGVIFDYGFSAAQVNRIEILNDRSNFVREDYMVGTYGAARTVNLPLINYIAQGTIYYPLYHTFNGMEQSPKQTILYAGDIFLSPIYTFDYFRYIKFDAAVGLHFMYQLTDEYHMHYLGAGIRLGVKAPIFRQWDLVSDFMFTLDNANIGKNRLVQPFDVSYQYHVNVGFRYTTKMLNTDYYVRFGKRD